MSASEAIKSAVEQAASSSTVGTTISAATISAGSLAIIGQVQTVLGLISVTVGIIVGLFVIRVKFLEHKLLMRKWNEGLSQKDDAE